jgi:hypothetical protein
MRGRVPGAISTTLFPQHGWLAGRRRTFSSSVCWQVLQRYHRVVFGAKGLRKRIGTAVARILEPGEIVQSTVYLHVLGDPSLAVLTALPVNIRTWIAVLTDRRVILLKGNETNAARSERVAAYPRSSVTVPAGDGAALPKRLELHIRGKGSLHFEVPLLWRQDAERFVAGLG